ncbi:MAG TPA: hypothetical protein VGZ50_06510 [Actinomycetota bacterium]|nr:hypothetical protein [Actinomycetota bacterium]
MNKFMFLYKGFVPPTPEIGRSWMEWFSQVGDSMADSGNPISGGVEVTPDDVNEIELGTESFTGYSIVNAESMEAAVELAKTNPMITSVVVYELARM